MSTFAHAKILSPALRSPQTNYRSSFEVTFTQLFVVFSYLHILSGSSLAGWKAVQVFGFTLIKSLHLILVPFSSTNLMQLELVHMQVSPETLTWMQPTLFKNGVAQVSADATPTQDACSWLYLQGSLLTDEHVNSFTCLSDTHFWYNN